MKRLAIITTHPIQYNAPLFKLLQQRGNILPKVFYTWGETVLQSKYDPGFDKLIEWDIPLLEGYEYEFLENVSKKKGSHYFRGIVNPDIIKKIRDWQPHALLIYGWKFHSHLKVMRYFKNKIPVLFRGDSTLLDEKKNLTGLLKRIFIKRVYNNIDKAFYCGTNNKNYFLYYGLKESQLIPAYHAVDNKRFDNSGGEYSNEALAIRSKFGIKQTDKVFLYAGKLTAEKSISSLINAFIKLNIDSVQLVIAGNGPVEELLKRTSSNIRNLHFLDFQNQQRMPVIYQLCDVFVLPSNGETWGLSINEAMAGSKAIVVSDKTGCAVDLVSDGENGYIFKTGDENDLLLKMQRCVSNARDLQRMQKKSYEKISEFSFDKVACAIEQTVME